MVFLAFLVLSSTLILTEHFLWSKQEERPLQSGAYLATQADVQRFAIVARRVMEDQQGTSVTQRSDGVMQWNGGLRQAAVAAKLPAPLVAGNFPSDWKVIRRGDEWGICVKGSDNRFVYWPNADLKETPKVAPSFCG